MAKCISRVDESMDYRTFYEEFLMKNIPCILNSSFTSKWPSISEWVRDGRPCLINVFKSFEKTKRLPVANCRENEFGSHPKLEMTSLEYETYWMQHERSKDDRLLYLKDWHFCWTYPASSVYQCHEFFSSDWMNEFWDFRRDVIDDFRFVYIGPSGTWTPFHADVYRSYSWSTNICGRKRWLLFPPGEEEKLRGRSGGQMPFDVREKNLDGIEHFDVIQETGETIFVPSGWHHQVMNIADTISLNHNWINACAMRRSWKFLQAQLQEVEESIRDVEDTPGWKEQAQIMMKAYAGISYFELLVMIKFILTRRLIAMFGSDDRLATCLEDQRTSLDGMNAELDSTLAALMNSLEVSRPGVFKNQHWLLVHDIETSVDLLIEMENDDDMQWILRDMKQTSNPGVYQKIKGWISSG